MACENRRARRSLPVQSQRSQSPGKKRREFFRGLNVKRAGLLPRHRQPLKRMKIADRVYLIADQLQTGARDPNGLRFSCSSLRFTCKFVL